MEVGNLHLTLLFLGPVEAADADCLCSGAQRLQVPPFTLSLRRLGGFGRAGVRWIAPEEAPAPLLALAAALRSVAADCALVVEQRPFHAHVTLARKVRRPAPALLERALTWPVDAFCLVESRSDRRPVEYRVLRRWPLSGAASTMG